MKKFIRFDSFLYLFEWWFPSVNTGNHQVQLTHELSPKFQSSYIRLYFRKSANKKICLKPKIPSSKLLKAHLLPHNPSKKIQFQPTICNLFANKHLIKFHLISLQRFFHKLFFCLYSILYLFNFFCESKSFTDNQSKAKA